MKNDENERSRSNYRRIKVCFDEEHECLNQVQRKLMVEIWHSTSKLHKQLTVLNLDSLHLIKSLSYEEHLLYKLRKVLKFYKRSKKDLHN